MKRKFQKQTFLERKVGMWPLVGWIFLGLLLTLVLFSGWQLFRKPRPTEKITEDKFFAEADTGDLIFFSGTSFGERSIKLYSRSVWTHVGIVFRDDDSEGDQSKLFLAEADVGQRKKDGPRVILLSEKFEAFRRRCSTPGEKITVGWKKWSRGPRPDPKKIMAEVQKLFTRSMDLNMGCWIFARWPDSRCYKYFRPDENFSSPVKSLDENLDEFFEEANLDLKTKVSPRISLDETKNSHQTTEPIFCSEFITEILMNLPREGQDSEGKKILGREKIASWYSPQSLARDDFLPEFFERMRVVATGP